MARSTDIWLQGKGHRRSRRRPLLRRFQLMGLTAGIVLMVFGSVRWMGHERRVRQAQLDVSRIAHAVRLFRADFGRCPVDLTELVRPPEGSSYIVEQSDPWGRDYLLRCPAGFDAEDVEVMSQGPVGGASGDVVRSLMIKTN